MTTSTPSAPPAPFNSAKPASPARVPKVLLVAATFEPGAGGVSVVARLTLSLLADRARAGLLRLRVVSLFGGAQSIPGVDWSDAGRSRLKFALAVQTASLWADRVVFDSANMAQARARFPRRPDLVYLLGVELWENALPRWIDSARRATVMASISSFTRSRADALHGGFARARVCHLGIERDDAPQQDWPARLAGPPQALIVSRIEANENYKGHRELIAAWPEVAARVPGAVLNVVGRGSGLDAMRRLAADAGLGDAVVFHGFMPDDALDALYRRCRLFVMPSRGEGFGLVYLEAMRVSMPVIASIHDAAPEVVLDGATGYTVDLDAPGQLTDRLVRLLLDDNLTRSLGEAGRERFLANFTRRAFEARLSPILDDLIGIS